ncbi:hypothetical protein [Lacrimispora xylanisolvens]|uniref:hypothetical protein n=1 Tax=Lacrimispora xylanisolvens TaxID=384636 RepID=UPI002402B299
MDFHKHREIIKKLKRQIETPPSYDILNILLSELQYTMQDNPDLPVDDRDFIMAYSGFIKKWAVTRFVQTMDTRWDDLYWKTLHFEAPYLFESYLIYLEKNREAKDRFYLPKRKQLNKHGLIQAMQDLEDDRLDILSISMPPGTQKTTLEKFFASWVIGKHPDDFSLFYSHSGDITRMFYDGIYDITINSDEYTWSEIFPDVKLESTNAKTETINFNKYKPFPNIQCTSIGSKNAGKVRCNRYLYCDDLIGGIEEVFFLQPQSVTKCKEKV